MDFSDGLDSGLTLATAQDCFLMAYVVPKLNQRNKGGYFRATPPKRLMRTVPVCPDRVPLSWRSGMVVSPGRLSESVVGTTHVLPQWGTKWQPQTSARIQFQLSCDVSHQGCAGGKEVGWYLDIVKVGRTRASDWEFIIQFYNTSECLSFNKST